MLNFISHLGAVSVAREVGCVALDFTAVSPRRFLPMYTPFDMLWQH